MFTFIYNKSIIYKGTNVILRQDENESNDEFDCLAKDFYGGLIVYMAGEIQN
jgi:hypothetical protein